MASLLFVNILWRYLTYCVDIEADIEVETFKSVCENIFTNCSLDKKILRNFVTESLSVVA